MYLLLYPLFFSASSPTGETGGGGGGGSSEVNADVPEGNIGINAVIAWGVGVVISFGSYNCDDIYKKTGH